MANRELFHAGRGIVRPADTVNAAGGKAYAFGAKHALAQMAVTGSFNGTYYESAEAQLDAVLSLIGQIDPEFVAKTAVYARKDGAMKDMPALLCAALSTVSPELFEKAFPRVVNSGKMLRNFVQIVRSGVCGRKSLGSSPKQMIRKWFAERSADDIFFAAVGNNPTFADVIRLVHPKPDSPEREALYKWLLGYKVDAEALPRRASRFVAWKQNRNAAGRNTEQELPDAPFLWLMGCSLSKRELVQLVPHMPWTALRMNLIALARNGALADRATAALVARRLVDHEEIVRAKAFPYQMFQTALAVCDGKNPEAAAVPHEVKRAVVTALNLTLENTPLFTGRKVYVLVDVSGSMKSPITGHRKGATTVTRCADAAALIATAIAYRNPDAQIVPFEHDVVEMEYSIWDGVFANARKLAAVGGGGTDTAAPLYHLNNRCAKGDLVVYVSDNESWIDKRGHGYGRATATMDEWARFKYRNPKAKLVCWDLQPNRNTQAPDRDDILNVGGFSDAVFEQINTFVQDGVPPEHWVDAIEKIVL